MKTAATKKGINKDAYLVRSLFDATSLKQLPTRDGFGEGLVAAGAKDPRIVALCADLSESTRTLWFKQKFPERFVQLGVSEQSMASIAAGMALAGKIPFIASYAGFSPGRNWEQIRTCIALNDTNVKIAGAHSGVSVGPDGATHQMIEDIAIMRVLPNMQVFVPCDMIETRKTTLAIAQTASPSYVRFAREKTPVFTTEKTPFKIGRAELFRFGSDATIVAAGPLVYEALVAAQRLSSEYGLEVRVINCHTIKPLDSKILIAAAKETGAVVTLEEAQAAGGLGGAVAEVLTMTTPVPIERMGMQDRFGESGEPNQLLEVFGLTAPFVAMAVMRAINRKCGARVSEVPEYVLAARDMLAKRQKEVWEEAMKRTPKKWGGKKPDGSLKSRARVKK